MTRIMGDSTNILDIPKQSVDIVAGYVNGHWGPTTPSFMEAHFPHTHYGHVLIDVTGSRPDVQVRDWENGDKGGNLEQWVKDHNHSSGHKDAVIYCNRSTVPEVRRLTASQVLNQDYFLWVATGDGAIVKGTGIIACQNKWQSLTGGHWDSSQVWDDRFWKAAGVPSPPPAPTPQPPHKLSCAALQRSVRAPVDGIWGPQTDHYAETLIDAWHDKFPFGVLFAQKVVGTKGDGVWGPNSKRSMKSTTVNVQRALTAMGFHPGKLDGAWGPNTQSAYDAAKKACHI